MSKGIVYKDFGKFEFSMRIAAKTTNLDFIEVCPVNDKINVRYSINIFKTKKWQEKLINKCAKIINSDIETSLLKDKKSIFFIYMFDYHKFLFNVRADLHYDIISKNQIERRKINNERRLKLRHLSKIS